MTGRIPEEKIQEIRERTDIVEVISSYIPLKRSGVNYLGLCPFHSEKTPSFNVNADRQIFHCFGCGVGGNVFSFLMRMEGLPFPEAVRRLGDRAGIELQELSPTEEKQREESERFHRINEVACEFYHRILMEEAEGIPGRRYLKERGFNAEISGKFRLGYAPKRWEALAEHLADKGFDPKWVQQLGLVRPGKEGRGDYDLFRTRLLFPILDLSGQVAAFGGRVLDDSLPKYINSPESPIYHKGRILYGLYQGKEEMRRTGEVIVVEGYFDQLALYRAGFGNVVATCGTALTEDHARLLRRYIKRVILLFDQDRAGQKATFRAMDVLIGAGLCGAVVSLDAGEDPDSFLRKRGAENFRQRLAAAKPALEFFMEIVLAAHGDSIEGKAQAIEEILAKLRLLSSDIERDLYLKDLAGRTGLDEDLLRKKVKRSAKQAGSVFRVPVFPKSRQREQGAGQKAQKWLLHMMITDRGIRERVAGEGSEPLFFDEDLRATAEQILRFSEQEKRLEDVLFDGCLTEEQKAILSGILIKDERVFGEDPERIFNDCRRAAASERLKRRSKELPELIREAEQRGDVEKLAAYYGEQMEINRRLKSVNTQI
jgi:DNA primase